MFKSLPLTVLSLTLGFFFVFVGLLKVTPEINPTMHNDLVSLDFTRLIVRLYFSILN